MINELLGQALLNKDLFSSIILILVLVCIIMPFVIWTIKQQSLKQKEIFDLYTTSTEERFKSLLQLQKDNFSTVIEEVRKTNKTTLKKEQTVRLLKTEMWYGSKKKLQFIRSILLNNHIKGREDFIKKKVTEGLIGYSDEYLSTFKGYNTPIGDLSLWLSNEFSEAQFTSFVQDIIDVMFREDEGEKKEVVNGKMQEISLIMETLQNALGNSLRLQLNQLGC